MAKIGRPTRLIAYDTDINIAARARAARRRSSGSCARARSSTPRIIAVVGGIMLYTLATRDSHGISVIHDRNPIFVRLSDGAMRNAYTMRIAQQAAGDARSFALGVDGLPGAQRRGRRRAAARRTAA